MSNSNTNTSANNRSFVKATEMNTLEPTDYTAPLLLEQLNYIQSYHASEVSSLSFEEQLDHDLAIFADDSFVFPDEPKPKGSSSDAGPGALGAGPSSTPALQQHSQVFSNNIFQEFGEFKSSNNESIAPTSVVISHPLRERDVISESLAALLSAQLENRNNLLINNVASKFLEHLPKYQIPEGARLSLLASGLTEIQIQALAALVHRLQDEFKKKKTKADKGRALETETGELNILTVDSIFNDFNLTQFQSIDPILRDIQTNESFNRTETARSNSSLQHSRRSSSLAGKSPGSNSDASNGSDQVDEVRRRRNTAASARLRVKRRMQEREMERNLKVLTADVSRLKLRIEELQIENRLLKDLIIDDGN